MKITLLAPAAALIALSAPAFAQQSTPGETVQTLYGVISGPVGQERDWDLFRQLFVDGARMTIVAPTAEGERLITMSTEDYIERAGPNLVENGFTEIELERRTYTYGGMATVLSTYEGRYAATGEVVAVGLNTLVLVRDGADWKVASIAWRPADEEWPVSRAFEAE